MKQQKNPQLITKEDLDPIQAKLAEFGINEALIITPFFTINFCKTIDSVQTLVQKCLHYDKQMRLHVVNALATALLSDLRDELADESESDNESNKNLN